MRRAKIEVSPFINPDARQVDAAAKQALSLSSCTPANSPSTTATPETGDEN